MVLVSIMKISETTKQRGIAKLRILISKSKHMPHILIIDSL
jgi:hypothetical protein